MSELLLAAFVIAFGFVTAAIFTNIVSWMRGDNSEIALSFGTAGHAIIGILFLMVSGPYLVAGNGIDTWREHGAPAWLAIPYAFVVMLWSFCLGVLVIQTVFGLGNLSTGS